MDIRKDQNRELNFEKNRKIREELIRKRKEATSQLNFQIDEIYNSIDQKVSLIEKFDLLCQNFILSKIYKNDFCFEKLVYLNATLNNEVSYDSLKSKLLIYSNNKIDITKICPNYSKYEKEQLYLLFCSFINSLNLEMNLCDKKYIDILKVYVNGYIIEKSLIIMSKEFKNLYSSLLERFDIEELVYEICKLPSINQTEKNDLLFAYLYGKKWQGENLYAKYIELHKQLMEISNKLEKEKQERELAIDLLNVKENGKLYYSIFDIDQMNGYQFESFLNKLFIAIGYESIITKSSQDQGVDLVIKVDGEKIAVQAKNYSSNVGNSAIQEVLAGAIYYNCHKSLVVTNSYFTKQAIELANRTGVILWDRSTLEKLINSNPIKRDSFF